ncbi:ead/Ea22-like family protein [Klebsiella pneumoniae]|uniref:ead/Ea22-like family protein n=1 Tax=Klebsiella TaxID=570 RepID=UPI001CF63E41|nr:ead/Ea22-like family protein [Klebsiella pneumoniae]MCM2147000.1 ead/Ea22-like family protein [Klebsiella pneumoniae]MCM2226886.1 ead/Ea22-like family protein [Klebsiella pneumoniae]MDS7709568.1 ead/Ea22-like family protein [Klebsiella pneumoniae]MDS7736854.1 ead/Ea22-like family protein [Klebsiella pneumoniae]WJG05824.1 ead/Ea22-like family protein [Klebsiella pneumoniae]
MTTDITELAQSHELRNKVNHRLYGALEFQGTSGENATITLSIDECKSIIAAMDERITLVEALEKAQQERDNWRTSFDNERFRADKLKAHIDDIEPIRAAAEKLVRCKGRYHSELNYRALAALFGVTTPDLPSLEHENVHYADAAEMEIAALRQRIAELESRSVTVNLPDIMPPEAAPAHYWGSGESMAYADGYNKSAADLKTSFAQACSSAGVNVEFE